MILTEIDPALVMPYRSTMPKRSSKPKDINKRAAAIVAQSVEESTKNPAAVELGRLGGLKGGPARAAKLSKKRRSEIAAKAAKARWKNRPLET